MTVPGSIFSDIETWVRRIVKPPSNQALPSETIISYVNRFYLYDVPARLQLFELRRQYTFEAKPNIYMYQVPFAPSVDSQVDVDNNNEIVSFPGLQVLMPPVYCDGIAMTFFNNNTEFNAVFPEQVQNTQPILGDGGASYDHELAGFPFLRSFRDANNKLVPYVIISAESVGGDILYLVDEGDGTLSQYDSEFKIRIVADAGTVDYETGEFDFTFNDTIPSDNPITFQVVPYSASRPVMTIVYDNYIKLFPVPDRVYKIQFESQITPAQFLTSSDAIPYSYMSEYLARGAARKILSDTGDIEQLQFYEPFFKEQEVQVLRRTNRQQTTKRVPTIFSTPGNSYNKFWYR